MPETLNILAQQGETAEAIVRYTVDEVLEPYVWVLYAAFGITFIATPIMRYLALSNGIVDRPDMKRKAHAEPVAYLGGVAVFLGWLAGVFISFLITPHSAAQGVSTVHFPLSILMGATLITVVGLIDDVYGISPRVKIGGQLIAASALAAETVGTQLAHRLIVIVFDTFGYKQGEISDIIPGFDGQYLYLDPSYWLGACLVTFLVVGGCNAANLLDGLDGLASGVTAIVAAGFTFLAVCLAMGLYGEQGAYSPVMDPVRIVVCLALLGAVVGFLPYNFNPAMIFMGDAGSMLLGYLCISTIMLFAEEGNPVLVMAALLVFALPIIDTTIAIVRRKVRGQKIFSPDNQHLHHQLIRSGMSVKQAVITLYLMALAFAVLGGSMIFTRLRYVAIVFIVICGFVVVTAYKVGHRQSLVMSLKKEQAQAKGAPDAEPPADDADAEPDAEAASPDADTPSVKPAT